MAEKTTSTQPHRSHAELIAHDALTRSGATSRAVFVAQGIASSLIACVVPLLLARCMTQEALAIMIAAAIATAALLCTFASIRRRGAHPVAVATCALIAAFVAILAAPSAREGLFSLVNGMISRYDDVFSAYVPLVANTGLVAGDAVFSVCAGIISGALAYLISRIKLSGAMLLILALICGASMRLSLGFTVAASCCSAAAWLMLCRLGQLHGSSYSLGTLLVSVGAGALCCIAIFFVCDQVYTPAPAISEAYGGIVRAFDDMRFGSDSLPEGDLSRARNMNEGDGELDVAFDAAPADDVLLGGFVGTTFSDGAWKAIDHTAYEGQWTGMMQWLRASGLTPAFQRAAYDDEAHEARKTATDELSVRVDASKANSRYSYVPYTLRSISATNASLDIDGALRNFFVGAKGYRFTMDNVAPADVIDDTSWLEGRESAYSSAESVYSAFVDDNYLAIDDDEAQAVKSFVFNDETWDDTAATSEYSVISRVRTMLGTLASYTTAPRAPAEDKPFAQWFFEDAKAGNSAYFATASVLAFRSQGIPARYVEGYRASQTAAAAAAAAGEPLSLTSEDAHAWVEVYLDGVGWTPIEVTPGFYTQALEADSVIDVNEAKSNGQHEDILQSGSVSGQVDDDAEDAASPEKPDAAAMTLYAVVFLAVIALGAVAFSLAQRAVRISRRKKRLESDDQTVSVPELYRYLALLMAWSKAPFDQEKPLDCIDDIQDAFTSIDALEYRRIIELHQAFAFGEKTLRPNEMRTLRRFVERLHDEVGQPVSLRGRIRYHFVDAL